MARQAQERAGSKRTRMQLASPGVRRCHSSKHAGAWCELRCGPCCPRRLALTPRGATEGPAGEAAAPEAAARATQPLCEPAVEAVCTSTDLLKLLFSHLDLDGLCRVGATCQLWHHVSQSDDFWRTLDFQGRGVQHSQARQRCRLAPEPSAPPAPPPDG